MAFGSSGNVFQRKRPGKGATGLLFTGTSCTSISELQMVKPLDNKPSKEALLESLQPGLKLTKALFNKIYGYEISYPGFAEIALVRLEQLGSSKAREHYNNIVGEYEQKQNEVMRDAAHWYSKQSFDKKGSDKDNGQAGCKSRKREHRFSGLPQDW